ncbi:RteC domain-containing protein [Pedobacter frigoris]|uniref:RteC protein n=1 Tax=Pedobacter frigoris TaxID=2571272 RepID=A0A4U1CDD6_9SPHI|nr:RteC domain-containing protein [Pedobacter frigoris]TKC04332.1 hypothetical protein FA047_17255 [Pedobacter frigoris]
MMDEKMNGLLVSLEKELEGFALLSPLERMRSEIASVKRVLVQVYGLFDVSGFSRRSEEIGFFKVIKPRFYSLLILAMERYWMELERPIGVGADLSSFYDRQLDHIARFFRQHEFFYQYYRLGGVELDEQYFVKDTIASVLVNSDVPELDPSYATIGDYLFSKFMALERLREEILLEMQGGGSSPVVSVKSKKGRELRWTGDASNLIEILYGVFETKQFNDGEVDIADLVDVFERVFRVNLSNYFQRFAKIKQRKLVSKTKFLDEMVVAVAKRIDDSDAYVPSWAK